MRDTGTPLEPELTQLEAQLAGLAPRSGLNRDRLMFAAGRKAADQRLRKTNRVLTMATVAFAGLACLPLLSGRSPRQDLTSPTNLANKPIEQAIFVQPRPSPRTLTVGDSGALSIALSQGTPADRAKQPWEHRDEPPIEPFADGSALGVDFSLPPTSRALMRRYLESTSERL